MDLYRPSRNHAREITEDIRTSLASVSKTSEIDRTIVEITRCKEMLQQNLREQSNFGALDAIIKKQLNSNPNSKGSILKYEIYLIMCVSKC